MTGTSFSTTSINLDWLPVSEELRNGIIRKYEAFIYGAYGYNEQMTVQGPTRTAVFEGLVIFSNYSLKVRAFTRKGPGPWSSLINTTTSAGGMFLVTSSLNFCRRTVLSYTLAQLFESKFRILASFFKLLMSMLDAFAVSRMKDVKNQEDLTYRKSSIKPPRGLIYFKPI